MLRTIRRSEAEEQPWVALIRRTSAGGAMPMASDTLNELYREALRDHRQAAMFRRKVDGRWTEISTEEFETAVRATAHGLISLGIETGDRVALLSQNRLEWMQADLSTLGVGALVVPIYPTLLSNQVEYILRDAAPTAVFVENANQLAKIDDALAAVPSLKHIICFDSTPHSEAISLTKLRQLGEVHQRNNAGAVEERAAAVAADDPATVIYTSGTTGNPKGVLLTHGNIARNVRASLEVLGVNASDSCLCFLPLSHILERMAGYYLMLKQGVTINFAQSVETVAADLIETSPTVMISVPRLYEKIYARVLEAASSGSPLKRNLFFWAKAVGERWTDKKVAGESVGFPLSFQQKIADVLVFKKLRARTGGKMRFFVSGGAPLAKEIAEFFYSAGLTILEGYGLTETSPVITVNTVEKFRPGSVGPPIPGAEVRIAEDGEILTRSPYVMAGYYNLPTETAETIVDGWLYTGDIGHIDDDGFLFITDRKKALLVTAGGKNVAPQPVENALKLSKFVSEAVLVGDKQKYLVALLVPDLERLHGFASSRGLEIADTTEFVASREVQDIYARVVHETNEKLAQFERIKYFRVLDHEFTLEDGQLTPSLKVRRKVVVERYNDIIEEMYV
jgi:long-chain acyl-CoA synthetase